MTKDYHHETGVLTRYDEETLRRFDRLARTLSTRRAKVSRSAIAKRSALLGLEALEREHGIANEK